MSAATFTLAQLDELIASVGFAVREETLNDVWDRIETTADAPALPGDQVLLVVTMPVRPDRAGRFEAAAREFVHATMSLEGALGSSLHQALRDPSQWFLVERFADRAAFERHMASAYFHQFQVEQQPLLAGAVTALFLESGM